MKQKKRFAWILILTMLLSAFSGMGTISYADYADGTEIAEINYIEATNEEKETTQAIQVNAKQELELGLSSLLIFTGGSGNMQETALLGAENVNYPERVLFSPGKYQYTLPNVLDTLTSPRFSLMAEPTDATVKVVYNNGEEKALKSILKYEGTNWAKCIATGKNNFSIVVTSKDGQSSKSYSFTVDSYPTISALRVMDGKKELYLDNAFSTKNVQYTVDVEKGTKKILVDAQASNDDYTLTYNGEASSEVDIEGKDSVDIAVTYGQGESALTRSYTVKLNWKEPYDLKINTTPADAIISLYDSQGTAIEKNNDGSFSGLLEGASYPYTVTKAGYVGKRGTITQAGDIEVSLSPVPAGTNPLPSYSGDWLNFRGNNENMGITQAKTPVSAEEAALKWSAKYGLSYLEAPTPPIIVNGELYVAAGQKILRINKETGEKLAESGNLAESVGYAMNPLVYAEGMIFVQVKNGQIQALRADTLESLWVSEAIGDQTISPITYYNGYLYSGTWNKEEEVGSYFCVSITDEDPLKENETKLTTWKLNHKGGFYWAGAYATDNYVVFGSDDGSEQGNYTNSAVLYSCNPLTGEVLDTIQGIKGDIRSTVAYDKETDRIYFSTKGGWFYTVKVKEDGSFDKSTVKYLELGGMCTGTPLIYDGIAYLGVSGEVQFSGVKHSYKIIDVTTDPMTIVGTAEIPGYVQTSALLSTAYAKETGKVYIYTTYNYTPGGIYVIEVEKTGTNESGAAIVKTQGSHLFIPEGDLAQYCICSLVCDKDGTIYYKNDSGNLMAIKNTENPTTEKNLTGITITKAPNKVSYKAGERFDKTGMQITATYDDATQGIVTAWTVDKTILSKEDDKITVTYHGKTAEQKITVAEDSGGGASGGGGGGGGSVVSTPSSDDTSVVKNEDGKQAIIVTTTTEAKVNKEGNVSVSISGTELSSSLKKAAEAAAKNGKDTLAQVRVEIKTSGEVKMVEAKLPMKAMKEMAASEKAQLILATPVADVTLDQKSLNAIATAAQEDEISFRAERVEAANTDGLKGIEGITRPIYDLKLLSGKTSITSFAGGEALVSLPYTLAKNEKAANVCVYYIDNNANKVRMEDCSYDSKGKKVQFKTGHFSYYAIGYEESASSGTVFTDVKSKDWYAESVMRLVEKGILKGKSETSFAPNETITRAEFAQILYGMANSNTTDGAKAAQAFGDVKSGDWYAKAVAWAYENGIVKGLKNVDGSMNFAPNAKITRQDMAVMLQNYLTQSAKKELKAVNAQMQFKDAEQISAYAKEAVSTMQKAGILSGILQTDGAYAFAPLNNATRAEAATMIAKLLNN